MKRTKTLYWIFTIIFALLMLMSTIPNKEAPAFYSHLGYPPYIIGFLSIAKVLGVIAILVPGFPRIKEWAYAGLFFDLIGATYSQIATDGFQLPMLMMLGWIGFGVLSYVFYHKKLAAAKV